MSPPPTNEITRRQRNGNLGITIDINAASVALPFFFLRRSVSFSLGSQSRGGGGRSRERIEMVYIKR